MRVDSARDLHLVHHGIKGMKWGIRRFQNSDGTLTDAGKKRYGYRYVANGSTIAKPGIESQYGTLITPKYRYRTETKNGKTKTTGEYYNDSLTSKVHRKEIKRITKDKELRRLNQKYNYAYAKYGASSKETKAAKIKFEQRAQDLAVSHVRKYRDSYIRDLDLHLTKEGKRKLEQELMNEVYLGPPSWTSGMAEDYRKYFGLPNSL